MRWLLVPCLFALAACRTTMLPAPPPTATWELPLRFDAGGPPLVEVTVGGKPTLFAVDTAAKETALASWFAKSVASETELPLLLGTLSLGEAKWPVIEGLPSFEALGIGGVLSPLQAAKQGAIVLDFPNQRLLFLDGKMNVWMRWLDERSPKGQTESLPRAGPRDGTLYVKSRVGDGREVVTRLDSAAPTTTYVSSLFDPTLIADGGALLGPHVSGLHVRLGESEFGPLDVLARPALGAHEGALGLDVLRGVVLLIPVQGYQALWVMTPRE